MSPLWPLNNILICSFTKTLDLKFLQFVVQPAVPYSSSELRGIPDTPHSNQCAITHSLPDTFPSIVGQLVALHFSIIALLSSSLRSATTPQANMTHFWCLYPLESLQALKFLAVEAGLPPVICLISI